MSQQRQFQTLGGGSSNNPGGHYNDTTFTKIFVGGLAWETQRDTMRSYFEQFGEILEAVVITDKNTGRSKGYGFVTFKEPEAAMRACQNPSPVIDGRRANCNLASLGAQKPRPPNPQHGAARNIRPSTGLLASAPPYYGSSSYVHHPSNQYTFPYSAYGYTGYSPEIMYPMNHYGVYGGQQQYPTHYTTAGPSGTTGMFQSFYPLYTQYPQSSQQVPGFGVQCPPVVHYPYMPQLYSSTGGILSLPSTLAMQTTTGATTMTRTVTATTAAAITPLPLPPQPPIPLTIPTVNLVGARTGTLNVSGSGSEPTLSK